LVFLTALAVVVYGVFFSSPAYARKERWYLNVSLGYPLLTWQKADAFENVQPEMKLLGAAGDLLRVNSLMKKIKTLSYDIGAYIQISPKPILLGLANQGFWDTSCALEENHTALSSVVYIGPEPGYGVFVRTDLGRGAVTIQRSDFSTSKHVGFGALLGLGYSFWSEETRAHISLNFLSKSAGDQLFQALIAQVGVLF
jgi:hypothetical protein